MPLSIKQVKSILSDAGLPVEALDKTAEEICRRHATDLETIKEERDNLQSAADTLATVQAELDAIKGGDWQKKYEDEHKAYDALKKSIATEKANEEKKRLYKALLLQNNIPENRIDAIIKVTDLDSLTVADGAFENADAVSENIKKEWAGFILNEKKVGADVENPPEARGGAGMSRAAQIAAEYHKQLYGEKKGD